MKFEIIWKSQTNPGISASNPQEAMDLAAAHPGNPDYLLWFQVMIVTAE